MCKKRSLMYFQYKMYCLHIENNMNKEVNFFCLSDDGK